MNRKTFVLILGIICSAFTLQGQSNEKKEKPNILWIITDDQRADALECYNRATIGQSESPLGYVMSPNIDKLASEGILFVNAFCNSQACGPSRGSMKSGRYPFRNGHYGFELTHQNPDFVRPAVSQILRNNGYGTAIFGKTGAYIYRWGPGQGFYDAGLYDFTVHFKHDLQKNGVGDLFISPPGIVHKDGVTTSYETIVYTDGTMKRYVTSRSPGGLTAEEKAFIKQIDEQYEILRSAGGSAIFGGENSQPADKTIDASIVKEFKSYLRNAGKDYKTLWGEEATGADPDKPLLVNLSLHLPHIPVLPPKKYRDLFKTKSYNIPEFSRDELSKLPPQLIDLYNSTCTYPWTDEEKLQGIQDYYAFCAHGDELIGDAVEAFKQYCKANGQEYLIIFTVGDHGIHLGEQGISGKFSPWKQSVHDAAIVVSSDKKLFPPGKVFEGMVEYVDFAPTILTAGGVDVSDPEYDYLDGFDLAGIVKAGESPREYILGEMNLVMGHRAYMRSEHFAFSMRTRDRSEYEKSPYLNDDILWALTCDPGKADLALYDLRVDPEERNNVANSYEYRELAAWFRNKLGRIVLGDGRIECDWSEANSYNISNFAGGADDKKLDIPPEIIPDVSENSTP